MEKENENMATDNREFVLKREFNAPRQIVFKAFSEADRLARWWGPTGFEMVVCKVDFRSGGVFHYCMKGANGVEMWGKFVYREIIAPEKIVFINSFSDKDGGITRHPMAPSWPAEVLNVLTLEERNGKTILTLRGAPIHATPDERKLFEDNFDSMNQGFSGTMNQLETYLTQASE